MTKLMGLTFTAVLAMTSLAAAGPRLPQHCDHVLKRDGLSRHQIIAYQRFCSDSQDRDQPSRSEAPQEVREDRATEPDPGRTTGLDIRAE
ncbi:MAG: hypothetical protein AAFY65_08225 [Pseudomonadota bacterium]